MGKHVVLNRTKPFYNSGHEIMTDNFFASHSLAVELQKHNLTLLDSFDYTEMKSATFCEKTAVDASQFRFDHENGITLVPYTPKKI